MNKLATLLLPALLIGAPSISEADEPKKGDIEVDKTPGEHLRRPPLPKDLEVPKARRADVNLQAQGIARHPRTVDVTRLFPAKGKVIYVEGTLQGLDDGRVGLVLDRPAKAGETLAAKKKAVHWFTLVDLKKTPLHRLEKKIGQRVRLEIKKDTNDIPHVFDVLPPKR